jgi:phage/plasmid-like protein (TIGR03299 family)
MTQTNRIQEVLNQTDLNWTVREESLTTESGIIIPKQKAIVREDTNKVLSIHGEGYYPYQNHQLIELLDKVSQQSGLEIHRGGSFGDGQKVFIQLKSNDLKLGDDRIEGYITGINSFDGTTSLAFGPSNITISCQNTFFGAFRSMDTKVRHTKNMVMRVDDICKGLEKVVEEETKMFEDIKMLSETRMTKESEDWVTRTLFNIMRDVDMNDEDSISTVTRNKLSRFEIDLNGELKEKGDSLWGLFSGVTKWTTHSMNKGDETKNMENKMFSVYGQREREIFKELVEMV